MDNLTDYIVNNKVVIALVFILIVVLIWFTVKINNKEKDFNNEKIELITHYESKIDSLQIKHLKFASEVFSWSVRSELLRENTENLNQLLTIFVQESGADLVQLINPEDKIVLLSSDKKYEGVVYEENLDFELKESQVIQESEKIKIITPVMGFNKEIGILLVELNK